jgi:hypothetical protein
VTIITKKILPNLGYKSNTKYKSCNFYDFKLIFSLSGKSNSKIQFVFLFLNFKLLLLEKIEISPVKRKLGRTAAHLMVPLFRPG